jgi:hypothetical protein
MVVRRFPGQLKEGVQGQQHDILHINRACATSKNGDDIVRQRTRRVVRPFVEAHPVPWGYAYFDPPERILVRVQDVHIIKSPSFRFVHLFPTPGDDHHILSNMTDSMVRPDRRALSTAVGGQLVTAAAAVPG